MDCSEATTDFSLDDLVNERVSKILNDARNLLASPLFFTSCTGLCFLPANLLSPTVAPEIDLFQAALPQPVHDDSHRIMGSSEGSAWRAAS